jgi:hypothetical protein
LKYWADQNAIDAGANARLQQSMAPDLQPLIEEFDKVVGLAGVSVPDNALTSIQ